jgi:glycosyltransferase involved in cell wall biosynthesis
MRSADVLLNLSSRGPLAQVTLEAMACGVPVIAVSGGAQQDVVLDGTTGYLMTSTQPAPLARRIRQLLASPLREGMAIAAATRARDRYSWARIGTETLAVYEAAIQVAQPAAGEPEPATAGAGPADET